MKTGLKSALLGASLLAGPAMAASDAELSERHLALAAEAAGDELSYVLNNCNNIGKSYDMDPHSMHDVLGKLINKGDPRPASAFDNLHFLGTGWVTAWAVTTDEGIILLDALNNAEEAQRYIEDGLVALGLDPTDIKKIIVSHGHGDHYGGATYLKEKYGAEIIMSEADWEEIAKPDLPDDELWGRPPARETSVADGDTVSLGGTNVGIVTTPGHTPGTIALTVPVQDGREQHKAVIWGGNGLNFGAKPDRFLQMMDSADKIGALGESDNVDVFLSNHASLDDTFAKLDALETRAEGEPNPFVTGTEGVRRIGTALEHCVAAHLATFAPDQVPADL